MEDIIQGYYESEYQVEKLKGNISKLKLACLF